MRKFKSLNYIMYVLIGFVAFNLIWLALSEALQLKALPSPLSVYQDYEKAFENGLMEHTLASLYRVFWGLVISLGLAIIIGVSMGSYKKINQLLGPLLYFTYPIPKLALLPVVMILFGIGETSKIIIIVLIIVFQLIINIRDAVLNINREKFDALTSLNASSFQKLRHITIPAIFPELFSSLRVALGISMSALFFTETYGTDKGLGFYITDSWMRIDYTQMYFGICALSLVGFLIFFSIDLAESSVCKWRKTNK